MIYTNIFFFTEIILRATQLTFMPSYNFIFDSNTDKQTSFTHDIPDECLLGMGLGLMIFNNENDLLANTQHFVIDGWVDPIEECVINSEVYEGWNIDDFENGEFADEPPLKKYVLEWDGKYYQFNDVSFLQGVFTVFVWLNDENLIHTIESVYNTESRQYLKVVL